MSTISTQHGSAVRMMSYGHNTLGPLCLWQCFIPSFISFISNNEEVRPVEKVEGDEDERDQELAVHLQPLAVDLKQSFF